MDTPETPGEHLALVPLTLAQRSSLIDLLDKAQDEWGTVPGDDALRAVLQAPEAERLTAPVTEHTYDGYCSICAGPCGYNPAPPTDDEREALTDESLWDFANDLLHTWNIEDENPPSLIEDFRDRFVARFRRQGPITEEQIDELWTAWSETSAFEDVALSRVQETAFRAGAQAARSAES